MLTRAQLIDILFWELKKYFNINKKTINFLKKQNKKWLVKLDNMLFDNLKRRQRGNNEYKI